MANSVATFARRERDRKTAASQQWRQTLKLTVTRLDADGRYETLLVRDDGVSFRVKGVAHAFAIPHDLAHYVIEKALQLKHGFWGNVAAGAVFPSMNYIGGRRRPHAGERSVSLLKANAPQLNEAEVVVRIFNDTIEQGHSQTSRVLRERLKQRWNAAGQHPREFSPEEIAAVFADYGSMRLRWANLPVSGRLDLSWPH